MAGFWGGKRVFVTGANGFIGSQLSRVLVEQGADVFALIRHHLPRTGGLVLQKIYDKVGVIHGSLSDYSLLEAVLCEERIEVVFHLAAQSQVAVANTLPRSTLEANVMGSINLLEAMRAYHQRYQSLLAVVIASSDKAYGDKSGEPYKEDDPLFGGKNPGGPYEASKSCTHILARCYALTFQIPICVAALSNVYGGGDMNFERRVPRAMRTVFAAKSTDTVTITYSLPVTSREMLFIDDAVAAYRTLAQKLVEESSLRGSVFNFAGSYVVAEDKLFEMIAALAKAEEGRKVKVASGPGRIRSMEILTQRMDSNKAKALLGWTPSASSFEDHLKSTYQWYRDFFARCPAR